MATPQDSPRRRKQKARRTKQLAEWREKKAGGGFGSDTKAEAAPKKATKAPKTEKKSK